MSLVSSLGKSNGSCARSSAEVSKLLGSANKTVRKTSRAVITIKLAKRYRSALRRAGSITAQAAVEFNPRKGDARSRTLSVKFREKRA